MADNYLGRSDAPFGEKVWQKIDEIVMNSVRNQLSARRILYVEGPFGLGFKALPGPDRVMVDESEQGGAKLSSGAVLPVVDLQTTFTLTARDIAAYEERGIPFDAGAITRAALAAARKEDDVLLNGVGQIGVRGLLTADAVQACRLRPWANAGIAVEDVLQAVNQLDAAGFHGPYTLALAPGLYNTLFRLYPQVALTELQHLQTLVTDGVVKAPSLSAGGVLLASGRQFASILLGQDLMTSFVGPRDRSFEFVISETLALRLVQPSAVVVLQGP